MHGRLKVKTTKEQEEEKKKQREKKLATFLLGANKANEKRKNQEYDNEALTVTQQLLNANPDFYTMWNFRKEILLHLSEKLSEEEKQKLYNEELAVTESCLQVNPKSYGAWYQRCWVLNNSPKPDWQRELKLCNHYLELDGRNLHGWEYRKFIVGKANVMPEDELQFTMTIIKKNFSNYSSWHYRSKLLPLVYPDPDEKLLLKEDIYLEELELVQNAAFTDPDDQSAWFYHRWLLGRTAVPLAIQCIYISRVNLCCIVTFTKEIVLSGNGVKLHLQIDNIVLNYITWKPSNPKSSASYTWIAELPSHLFEENKPYEIVFTVDNGDTKSSLEMALDSNVNEIWNIEELPSSFKMELSAATSKVLEQELESCVQLQEHDPDTKWMLLTSVFIMRALDSEHFQPQVESHLTKLMEIDSYRKNYYKDLYSKFILEDEIKKLNRNEHNVELIGKGLTSLHHLQYLMQVTEINLSNNLLTSLSALHPLQCLHKLTADNNFITTTSGIEALKQLKYLSLKNNQIETQASLLPVTKLPLVSLNLTGNPLCDNVSAVLWLEENLSLKMELIL